MLTLSIDNVGENKYISHMTGGVPSISYTFQYRVKGVIGPWLYGGVFIADAEGNVTTFEWSIPTPEVPYPWECRFTDLETNEVSNIVVIDLNTTGVSWLWLIPVALVGIGIAYVIVKKKRK